MAFFFQFVCPVVFTFFILLQQKQTAYDKK
jgi:hypothetical protein